jgi:hypothetical protein
MKNENPWIEICPGIKRQTVTSGKTMYQMLALLDAGPANQRHRFDFMPGQIATTSPIQVFAEQNPQLRLAAALVV